MTPEDRKAGALRQNDDLAWAGLMQEGAVLEWLHDCYFAAVAGDAPTFECWPPIAGWHIHQNILALWGMPLGEMWDLEKLATRCRERRKRTFFVTSAPANVPGKSTVIDPSRRVSLEVDTNERYFRDAACVRPANSLTIGGVSSHANATAIL